MSCNSLLLSKTDGEIPKHIYKYFYCHNILKLQYKYLTKLRFSVIAKLNMEQKFLHGTLHVFFFFLLFHH